MAGSGYIGGGGSAWLNFTIKHGDGTEKWSAYDSGVKNPKVKVKVPGKEEIEVTLERGQTVEIEWK